jgi:hypothetical protein
MAARAIPLQYSWPHAVACDARINFNAASSSSRWLISSRLLYTGRPVVSISSVLIPSQAFQQATKRRALASSFAGKEFVRHVSATGVFPFAV